MSIAILKDMFKNPAKYNKFWVALVAGLTILGTVLSDGTINGAEWCQVAAAIFGPFGVFQASNDN